MAVAAIVEEFTIAGEISELFEHEPEIFFVNARVRQIHRAETGSIDKKSVREFQQLGKARGMFAAQNFFTHRAGFQIQRRINRVEQ